MAVFERGIDKRLYDSAFVIAGAWGAGFIGGNDQPAKRGLERRTATVVTAGTAQSVKYAAQTQT